MVDGAINTTVTFQDGSTYSAKVLGTDAYSDLAVLSTSAPSSELVSLTIANSSDLTVGDQVIAIGSPYGLTGSMTTGIISALGRTITENTTSGYAIADIIQTNTAINPGNSGGPLLNRRTGNRHNHGNPERLRRLRLCYSLKHNTAGSQRLSGQRRLHQPPIPGYNWR